MPYGLHLKVISHVRLCMHGISGVVQQFMHLDQGMVSCLLLSSH